MSNIFKNIIVVILSSILLFSVLVLGVLWSFSNNIPDYKFLKNYKPPISSKLYSSNGQLLSEFSSEKRIFVPYNSIPKNIIFFAISLKN